MMLDLYEIFPGKSSCKWSQNPPFHFDTIHAKVMFFCMAASIAI
jgi:hypothetical protein